jgi:hypothetical protein
VSYRLHQPSKQFSSRFIRHLTWRANLH